LEAAAETGLQVWRGVSVDVAVDGHVPTLDGPQDGLDELHGSTVSTVKVMHSVIEAVEPALDVIARHRSCIVGAYPHCGDYEPPEWIFRTSHPKRLRARRWAGSSRVRSLSAAAVRLGLST
jgi:hypothetical protein